MKIRIGYSPCPNDTFAFHALAHGVIDAPFRIEPVLLDIEELNRDYGAAVNEYLAAESTLRAAGLVEFEDAYARRAEAAGVAVKVKFQLIDYRDVTGQFDRITSVGMIEHVGAPNFGEYFAKTYDLLDPDGIMLTHTIGRKGAPGTTDNTHKTHQRKKTDDHTSQANTHTHGSSHFLLVVPREKVTSWLQPV